MASDMPTFSACIPAYFLRANHIALSSSFLQGSAAAPCTAGPFQLQCFRPLLGIQFHEKAMLEGLSFGIHPTRYLISRMPWLLRRIPPGRRGNAQPSGWSPTPHRAPHKHSMYLYELQVELNVKYPGCVFEKCMRLQIQFNASLLIVHFSWAQFFFWAKHGLVKGARGWSW